MATYKKRGYKPKTKEEQKNAIEEQSTTAEVFNTLDESASKTEAWIAKNQQYIYGAVIAIVVVVFGILGYQQFIQEPKEQEAANEMYRAQAFFEEALNGAEKDSLFNLSLNGGQGKYGFLDIIDNYGGTDAANQANYYAGMAYLHTKNYKEAIAHLDNFKAGDDILGPIAKGAIGDAFANLNQPEDALKYYKDAASLSKNDFTTPRYLWKAAVIALETENAKEALTHLQQIKDNYPNYADMQKVNVLIGKAEAMLAE